MSDKWLEAYRTNKTAIWIRCVLSNDEELFFDKFEGWKDIKKKCESEKLFFKSLSLQYRSHKVDVNISECDGVYLIRSVMGQIGSDTKNYYTFGRIFGNKVKKEMWLVPELIIDKEFEESIDECFPEAIIYNETQKN
jgi:sensor histidine kinase YesM